MGQIVPGARTPEELRATGNDEIDVLTRQFNSMVQRLAQHEDHRHGDNEQRRNQAQRVADLLPGQAVEIAGESQHQGDLHQLRRLQPDDAEVEPALGAAADRAERLDEKQQRQHPAEKTRNGAAQRCANPLNSFPYNPTISMALDHLLQWVEDDVPPPRAERPTTQARAPRQSIARHAGPGRGVHGGGARLAQVLDEQLGRGAVRADRGGQAQALPRRDREPPGLPRRVRPPRWRPAGATSRGPTGHGRCPPRSCDHFALFVNMLKVACLT